MLAYQIEPKIDKYLPVIFVATIYYMCMIIDDKTARAAAAYLALNDTVLSAVIAQVGPCTIRPHRNYYQELVQSIIGQQLSLQAAAAIEARFVALYDGAFPTPEQILSRGVDDFRAVGFSRAKAVYIQDLARHVLDGDVRFTHLDGLTNQQIIDELTTVKGIGEWTVHMFLIFCMGRMDVLPTGDLGIKNGVRALYDLDHLPAPADVAAVAAANHWHPYESVAAWYVWQSLTLTSDD